MAAPTLDGHSTGQFSGTSSGTVTLTTSNSNDVIVVCIHNGTASGSTVAVSNVTASGLSFSKRKQVLGTTGGTGWGYECWYAIASGALTSKVITVTLASSIDDCAIEAFGVSGANTSSPWDTDASLPAYNTNSAGSAARPLAPTFSTTQANDFVFVSAGVTKAGANTGAYTTSWTNIDFIQNGGGTNFACVGSWYERVTSTQSSVTASLTVISQVDDIIIVDAITADSTATNVNLVAASGTGAAAAFTNTISDNPSLAAVSSTGAAGSFAPGVSSSVTLGAVSATGAVGSFTESISVSKSISAVSAVGTAEPFSPILEFLNVPITTIMNAKAIPVTGPTFDANTPVNAALPTQVPLDVILNTKPIPMTGTMINVPIPGEGSVP